MMTDPNALELPFKVPALLSQVTENRAKHAADYATAKEEYRKRYKLELEKRHAAIEKGEDFRHEIQLPIPEQFLKEYDRAIAMLTRTTATEITLGQQLFNQLILDEWHFSQRFAQTSGSYSSSR